MVSPPLHLVIRTTVGFALGLGVAVLAHLTRDHDSRSAHRGRRRGR